MAGANISPGGAAMRSAACLTFLFVVATAVAVISPAGTFVLAAQEPAEPQEQAQEPEEEAEEEFLALGKKLYRSQCRMCHGEAGQGEGDLAQEMKLTVPDFTAAETKKKTEGELHYILAKGHGRMPGQGERLRPQQMWSMVAYLRTLTPPKEATPKEKPKE